VADETSKILVFAKNAKGNATPVANITSVAETAGVAADAADHIWAADFDGGGIDEYARTANGNAKPLRKIAGAKTTLSGPNDIAFGH
jgi:hypothetical protein